MSLSPALLELLVCPLTKTPLIYDQGKQELVSKAARCAYPIKNDIPVLLESEARPLEESER